MFAASKAFFSAVFLGIVIAITGCGSPSFDPATGLGKQAIMDKVNIALTKGDCPSAVATLSPVYNSLNSDNNIRMLMAAAYACSAHINLFKVLGDLTSSGSLAGSPFWEFLSKEFPSTTSDRVFEAGQLAQDALQAVMIPGAVLLPANLFNNTLTNPYNPASYSVGDRVGDANSYLFFTSMATIGAAENRFGNPYPNGKKSAAGLPWTTAATVDTNGCAYASAMVNLVDSLGGLATATTGSISTTFAGLQTSFKSGIYAACDAGCTTICAGGTTCPTCPLALRDRTSCKPTVALDPSSCAAAGITFFINNTAGVGWTTGP